MRFSFHACAHILMKTTAHVHIAHMLIKHDSIVGTITSMHVCVHLCLAVLFNYTSFVILHSTVLVGFGWVLGGFLSAPYSDFEYSLVV